MTFAQWMEMFQPALPFMQQEPEPDHKKIARYKSKESYVKAMSKGGRQTETAAERIVSAPPSSWFIGEEELDELAQDAAIIPPIDFPPSEKYPKGIQRPAFHIAFATLKGKEPLPNGQYRTRILAFWQGQAGKRVSPTEIMGGISHIIGGLVMIGGHITDVWVDPNYRSDKSFNLYKELRKFATQKGYTSLAPGDDLTSKSFRAAQAKHDWERSKKQG
jgi:hypothetical protein